MAAKVGLNCKAYRNTGNFASPVWNEITIARDLTINLTKDDADSSVRGQTWRTRLSTLKDAQVDLNVLHDPSVDDYNVLRDAFLNDTVIDFAFADGAIATTGT